MSKYCAFSWSSKNLAAAVGVPVDVLNRRIYFWINKVAHLMTLSFRFLHFIIVFELLHVNLIAVVSDFSFLSNEIEHLDFLMYNFYAHATWFCFSLPQYPWHLASKFCKLLLFV